ncbi:RNAPII degradation factor [Umbelopsis nana]
MASAARTKSQQTPPGTELKKLKVQYGTQLSTLKELFSEWSDEDLLFALQEVDGDLELAAVRISEGWANQWGEVKGKKTKKESVQKQKPVAATTENQRHPKTERGIPSSRGGFGGRGRGSTRGGRPANFGDRGRGAKSGKSNRDSQILSGQDQAGIDSDMTGSNAATTNSGATTKEDSNWLPSTPAQLAQTTWASLLRPQPAPEPIKEEAALASALIEEATKEPESQELEEARPVVEEGVSAVKEQSEPAEPIIARDNEPTISDVNKASENTEVAEPVLEDLPSVVKPKTPIGRRLKQDVPVILPGGGANLGSVGVRFGNLNLADDESALEEEEADDELTKLASKNADEAVTNITHTPLVDSNNKRQPNSAPSNQVYGDSRSSQTPSGLTDHASNVGPSLANTSYGKSEHQSHAQQQPPQQYYGQSTGDQHNTPYSYLPSQVPNGLSGYGMNPMASIPDYAMYGTEAQRAAMGYYDPTLLHHSPSNPPASAYQSRDKYNHDANNSASQQSVQSAGNNPAVQAQHQQHAYANVPYYPYYYMPNQFQGYQQPGYGQPFVNKSMYPMYQHASKPTASSSYTTAGSPYQHQYSPAASYEDMNAVHQQHGMVHDYQKHYGNAPQFQSYMGHQSSQTGQGHQGGKNDLNSQYGKTNNGQVGGNQPQPQHGQHQQSGNPNMYGQQIYSNYPNFYEKSNKIMGQSDAMLKSE